MKVNKKGIFFTFAAIVLSLIIITSFNIYTGYRLKEEMEVIEVRINTMNSFIIDLEKDIENVIFISGFRSLLSLEDYLMDHDEFFNDGINTPGLDTAFEDVFLKGTITYGSSIDHMALMDNNTFLNWTKRIKVKANKTGIELEFTVNDVTIDQSEPWKVDVEVDLTIKIDDKKNTASWTITKPYTGKINITGSGKFVDPLYLIYTNGLANNEIRQTTEAFPGGSLITHLDNSYYIENIDAPSYLNRFEDDKKFTASVNGIESLADVPTLIGLGLGLPGIGKTAVDHIYFSSSTPIASLIEGMDVSRDWFYLDYTVPCTPGSEGLHMEYYDATCDI